MQVYDGAVDKGLEGVIACTTAISSIVDATLCYRGYTIEDLAKNSNFEEVVFTSDGEGFVASLIDMSFPYSFSVALPM